MSNKPPPTVQKAEQELSQLRADAMTAASGKAEGGADTALSEARELLAEWREFVDEPRGIEGCGMYQKWEAMRDSLAVRTSGYLSTPTPAANGPGEAPCRHEWYQGFCAHCEINASDWRKSRPSTPQPGMVTVPREPHTVKKLRQWRDEGMNVANDPSIINYIDELLEIIAAMRAGEKGTQ